MLETSCEKKIFEVGKRRLVGNKIYSKHHVVCLTRIVDQQVFAIRRITRRCRPTWGVSVLGSSRRWCLRSFVDTFRSLPRAAERPSVRRRPMLLASPLGLCRASRHPYDWQTFNSCRMTRLRTALIAAVCFAISLIPLGGWVAAFICGTSALWIDVPKGACVLQFSRSPPPPGSSPDTPAGRWPTGSAARLSGAPTA